MIPTIQIPSLSPQAQRVVAPNAPEKLQEVAARGIVPGVKQGEVLAVIVLLSSSERAGVRENAQKTLAALPEQLLTGALASDLAPMVIDVLARAYPERVDVFEKLLAMPQLDMETVEHAAQAGDEAVTELIATNEDRLLKHPRIIELLYMNKRARMSTADRMIELAVRNGIQLTGIPAFKEAAIAIQDELIAEPTAEPTPDDILFSETRALAEELASPEDEDTHVEDEAGKEVLRKKYLPLYLRIATMTVTQKIRAAMLGSKEERMLLIRDNNKIVATAAVRSPLMQESEAALVSRNRNVAEEVLRVIGSTPELMKSYIVKKNLVENPKTPVMIASRLVAHLRESDLRQLAKSKNVTGPVQDAARRHLERRKN